MSAENPPVPADRSRIEGSSIVQHGRLLVCATPIGNLEDVTLRVLRVLGEADCVACEDTRRTRVLLDRHSVRARRLVSLHEHNERRRGEELLERMRAGATVALVSDAGMPLISDPGFGLVRECLAQDIPVEVLPGASAVPVALVASGLPVDRWCFVGFLPRKRGQRERLLAESAQTLVAFESPQRLSTTLDVLAHADPQRPVAVCRELTKLHEEIVRATAGELAERYRERAPRGEIVLVVGPAAPARPGEPGRDGQAERSRHGERLSPGESPE
jgi:16S rRNA (cytidine1402-2'-O)-methyltransferase